MKPSRSLYVLVVVVVGLFTARAESIILKARPGSTVRLDGTSTVHDWTMEGRLIGGSVEVQADFPVEPGQQVEPGELEVDAKAFIPITSLRSVKDGKPYSSKMDDIAHEKLGKPDHKTIAYELDSLQLKSSPESAGAPYTFDSKGRLIVGGVTNSIEFPVKVTPMADGKVKFATSTSVRMSDYGIDPPAPKLALGMIKTGDEVQITIEWMTAKAQSE